MTTATPPHRSLLRHPGFRLLFYAQAVSQIGTRVSVVALPLVAVLVLQASPWQVGLLAAAQTVPFLLIGLPSGVWVDRMRKRGVLVAADLARATMLATVPAAAALDALSLAQLYGVALATGVATVFFEVAYHSYLPLLVGQDNLVEGNAKLEAVRAGVGIGGPGAAGWLVQLVTAPFAILADAASFVVSALFLVRIRQREPRPAFEGHRGLWREIGTGLAFVGRHPVLRMITTCTAIANLAGGCLLALTVLFLSRVVGLGPGVLGTLMAAGPIGALVGAVAAGRLSRLVGSARIIWIAPLVTSPFELLIPLTAHGWRLGLFAVAAFMMSFGSVVYSVTQVSYRQAVTPQRLLGRMNATIRFIVWGTLPLGALLGGALGELAGVRHTLWVVACMAITSAVPLLLSPLVRMREIPSPATEPDAGPGAESGSGQKP